MHLTWNILEISQMIFRSATLGRRDLFHLALVCKRFNDAAIPVLWEDPRIQVALRRPWGSGLEIFLPVDERAIMGNIMADTKTGLVSCHRFVCVQPTDIWITSQKSRSNGPSPASTSTLDT